MNAHAPRFPAEPWFAWTTPAGVQVRHGGRWHRILAVLGAAAAPMHRAAVRDACRNPARLRVEDKRLAWAAAGDLRQAGLVRFEPEACLALTEAGAEALAALGPCPPRPPCLTPRPETRPTVRRFPRARAASSAIRLTEVEPFEDEAFGGDEPPADDETAAGAPWDPHGLALGDEG